VFVVAWGGVVAVVGPAGIASGATPEDWQLLPVFGAMLLGPAVAGLAVIALTDRGAGLRDLWARQRRWRVGLRWYGVALLTTPILLLGILLTLSRDTPVFFPAVLATDDVAGVVALALVFGLLAGLFEEVGWTGFALPRLRRRYPLLVSGLSLGFVWGVWHGVADYWGAAAEFGALWGFRIGLWVAALTAFRVLLAWVYENTESLLVAQLMHASFTGSQGLLVPALAPADHFRWYLLFTAALWALVTVLALTRWYHRRDGVRPRDRLPT
jgi:membrane protease YdiL (CAAX protease family)